MIREHNVRNELIINFDELNAEVIPSEAYTMDVRGVGQVRIAGTVFILLPE